MTGPGAQESTAAMLCRVLKHWCSIFLIIKRQASAVPWFCTAVGNHCSATHLSPPRPRHDRPPPLPPRPLFPAVPESRPPPLLFPLPAVLRASKRVSRYSSNSSFITACRPDCSTCRSCWHVRACARGSENFLKPMFFSLQCKY